MLRIVKKSQSLHFNFFVSLSMHTYHSWTNIHLIIRHVSMCFSQANFVADLFKDQNHYSVEEKHRTADYETGAGTQVNNGTTNRNCWPNELALRLLTTTRPWLSYSCLWEASSGLGEQTHTLLVGVLNEGKLKNVYGVPKSWCVAKNFLIRHRYCLMCYIGGPFIAFSTTLLDVIIHHFFIIMQCWL